MSNPFRTLPEPLRVHILFEIAHHVGQRELRSLTCMFPEFGMFLRNNHGAILEMMDALTAPVIKGKERRWLVFGKLHRGGGLPAIEAFDGTKEWYVDNKRHRGDGLPAIERSDGSKQWWVDDKLHRGGGLPAMVCSYGYNAWFVDGKRHRDGGLPAVEWDNDFKQWWIHGICQPTPARESGKRT